MQLSFTRIVHNRDIVGSGWSMPFLAPPTSSLSNFELGDFEHHVFNGRRKGTCQQTLCHAFVSVQSSK